MKDRIELPVAVIHQPAPVDPEAAEVEAIKREEPRLTERRRSDRSGKASAKALSRPWSHHGPAEASSQSR